MHAKRSITSTVRHGGLSTSTMGTCGRVGQNASGHRCRRRPRFKKSEKHRRRLRCTTLFVLLLVLVLVLVLVLEAIEYTHQAHWSASYPEPPRSTIGIAAVQTAIEYEYRFTEYRFAEYEYDEIRKEARTTHIDRVR